MNAKKYIVATIILSAVLLAFAASFRQAKRGDCELTALTGPSGKFGRMIETILPVAKAEMGLEMLNLETGRAQLQSPLDFNSRADVMMAWVRSNGLDVSGFAWSGGAGCVTYDMTVVAVEGKSWEEVTEGELLGNPALALGRHSPRRLLLQGPNRPDTYLFRTGEGTLGMLRIVGVSQDGRGVKICYKLINPARGENSVAWAIESRAKQDL